MRTIHDYRMKFITMGMESVGKTTLLRKLCDENFKKNFKKYKKYESTIVLDMYSKMYQINTPKDLKNGTETYVKVELWDTAGQERFDSMLPMYYNNAICVILVYDVNNRDSFDKMKTVYQKVSNDEKNNDKKYYMVIGTKSDLSVHNRHILYEEGFSFAQKNEMLFCETSNFDFDDFGPEMKIREMLTKICNDIDNGLTNFSIVNYNTGIKRNMDIDDDMRMASGAFKLKSTDISDKKSKKIKKTYCC